MAARAAAIWAGAHLLEVHGLQLLALADAEGRVQLGGAILGGPLLAGAGHGFGEAAGAGGGGAIDRGLALEQGHGSGVLRCGRVAPEEVEGAVEDFGVLVALHHQGRGGRSGPGCGHRGR